MTTASDIITAAFREGNIIPVGSAPNAKEQIEGLATLNRFLDSIFSFVMGAPLTDWPVPYVQRTGTVAANPPLLPGSQRSVNYTLNNAYPGQDSRIVWNGSEQTVYFPELPHDGARMALVKASGAATSSTGTLTLDGNGRTIEAADTYTTDANRRWFYNADAADWKALVALELTDTCPFPEDFDDYWITATAIRLAPRYGKKTAPETVAAFKRLEATFKTRYQQYHPEPSGLDDVMPSNQTTDWWCFR